MSTVNDSTIHLDGVVSFESPAHPPISATPTHVKTQQMRVRCGEWRSASIVPVLAVWFAFYAIAIIGALGSPPSVPAAVQTVAGNQ